MTAPLATEQKLDPRENARNVIRSIEAHLNEPFLTMGARALLLDARMALRLLLNDEGA
jgi:hypothetical protein